MDVPDKYEDRPWHVLVTNPTSKRMHGEQLYVGCMTKEHADEVCATQNKAALKKAMQAGVPPYTYRVVPKGGA